MIGQSLSHYVIRDELGAGGMGIVYRAHDTNLQRDVALKLIGAAQLRDRTAAARFHREALALSKLNHPNICTIYDSGEANGTTFLAMELVEGRPLNAVIPANGLDCQTALRYGRQIADALAHAHAKGILHRDLKSSNVMVTGEGRIKLLDFGLAKQLHPAAPAASDSTQDATTDNTLTEQGSIVGTLAYMAPEVLRGESATERADVWALGVILHEMLAGSVPYKGPSTFELTAAILNDPPPALPKRAPAGAAAIVGKCLAKQPAERYASAAEVSAALEAVASGAVAAGPAEPTHPKTAHRTGRRVWLAVAAACLVGAIVLALRYIPGSTGSSRAEIRSIAVLPFDSLSKDADQQFFADGVTDQLISDLSKVRSLRVISRNSAMQYRGTDKKLPQIGQELGVDALVVGSVSSSGDKVRIASQLIRVPREEHLWSETYNRDASEVLSLQREVARTIANEIRITMTPVEETALAGGRKVDPEVHQLVLRGKHLNSQGGEANLRRALEHFERAVIKDPAYAPAHAGVAVSNRYLGISGKVAPHDVMPKSKAAAEAALRLDESVVDAHVSLAHVHLFYDWDWSAAERHIKRAIELNPSSAEAHLTYGSYFIALGRSSEAIAEMRRAQVLDPLSAPAAVNLMFALLGARRYDEVITESEKLLEREPGFPWAYLMAALAHVEKGDFQPALANLEKVPVSENSTFTALAAHIRAASGDRKTAEQLIANFKKVSESRFVCAYEVAHAYVKLGDKDKAFEWLEKGREQRADCMVWLATEPWMDPLRNDPRYHKLVSLIGLRPDAAERSRAQKP
jgi:serine/threonine-protein kinase